MIVCVGTYTGPKSRGIYLFEMDGATGALTPRGVVDTPHPAFLAVDPAGARLYAANEMMEYRGEPTGAVSAFALDRAAWALIPIDVRPSCGTLPCHLSVDASGRTLLVSNYGSGSVAALPVRADGGIDPAASVLHHQGTGPDASRQEGPHPHAIYVSPDNRFALVPDLGLDRVVTYRLAPDAAHLEPADCAPAAMPPGSGPRHLAFHPDGAHAYVIGEMGSIVTVCGYAAATGALSPGPSVSTLPDGWTGASTTAEIAVHPSGRFVYGSNRGHDSIAVFAVEDGGARLRPAAIVPTGGQTPRSFALDPTGAFLAAANADSDAVVMFRIDPGTGVPIPTGYTVPVGTPVCVLFVP